MQMAERSTRSTHKHVTQQPEPDPALLEDSGSPGNAPATRVIPTRSSKMADATHPRPSYAKPARPLHPTVRFRKEGAAAAEQAFAPRECVTRRIHGAVPAVAHRRDGNDVSRFELRIAKLCDAAVHLIDPFGNSIEILTDVFHTYTLTDETSATEDGTAPVDETASAELPEDGETLESDSAAEAPPPAGASIDQTEPAAGRSTAPEEPCPAPIADNAAFPTHEGPSKDATPQPPLAADDEIDSSPEAPGVTDPPNKPADLSELPTAKVAPPPATTPDPMIDDPAPSAEVLQKLSAAGEQNPELTESRQTCDSSGEEPGELPMQVDDEPAPADLLPAPESSTDQVGHLSNISNEMSSPPRDDSKEGPPTNEAATQNCQDSSLPDPELIQPLEEEHPAVEARGAPEGIDDVSERDVLLQPLSSEREKSSALLARQPIPRQEDDDDELVTADTRGAELFSRDIFQLEPPIVCDREDDVGGNMKYISESEMIELLEQDKDEAAEPPEGDGDRGPSEPHPQAESGPPATTASSKPHPLAELGPLATAASSKPHPLAELGPLATAASSKPHPQAELGPLATAASKPHPQAELGPLATAASSKPHPQAESGPPATTASSKPHPHAELGPAATAASSKPHPQAELGPLATAASSKPHPQAELGPAATAASSMPHPQAELGPLATAASSKPHPQAESGPATTAASSKPHPQAESGPVATAASKPHPQAESGPVATAASSKPHPQAESSPAATAASSKPHPQAESGPDAEAAAASTSPTTLSGDHRVSSDDKADLYPPPRCPTDEKPGGGTEEPPARSPATRHGEGAAKATGDLSIPPSGDHELCRTSTEEPQIKVLDQHEENARLCAETSTEAHAADPDDVTKQQEHGALSSSSPRDKMDVSPLSHPHGEPENKAMEPLPSDGLDHEPSAEDGNLAGQTSSPECTATKDKGPSADKREDGADLSSTEKVQAAEAERAECSDKTATDPETIENVSLDLEEPKLLLPQEADDVEKFIADTSGVSLSRDQFVCQDDEQESPEESEQIDEEPEERAWKTPERPTGAGAECLKCGRRVRRGRKEQVWSPVCFKCRLVAKRKGRLSNRSESPEFPEDAGREGGTPVKTPHPGVKREKERSQDVADLLPSLDPVTGDKKYECPKCDEAFKIPAQLAGHMKCHMLPQCLTCGCQIPLKYKTKRIPRRCQKCIQQMREGKSPSRLSGDELSGASDNEEEDKETDKGKRGKKKSLGPSLKEDEEETDSFKDEGKRGKKKSLGPSLEEDEEETDSFKDEGKRGKKKSLGPSLEEDEEDETDKELNEKQEADSSSDELEVMANGEKPRLCPQCGKAFKCNRSLNLHLLSHTVAHCESCGCRLQKKRRGGRGAKKCRGCKLQGKGQPSGDGEAPMANVGDKASKRLKAKQVQVSQKKKLQTIMKQKKELKWKNMLLAVKKLMNKSKKRKEQAAAQNLDPDKKKEEGEKDEASSANDEKTSTAASSPDNQESEPSGSQDASTKTPKQGRKCSDKQKNVIKIEEEDVLPCMPDVPVSPEFVKQEETWQCVECNQSLENLEALISHQRSHIDGQSFTCPQCPQVFSSEDFVNLHVPAHENRPFHCPECGKTFTKRNHLGVHLRVHSGMRPFACPDCPRRFRQKATLLSHRYSHRNLEISLTKPHQCSVCHKSFKQKERLVIHERVHTGECPFSCKDCDKKFPSRSKLYFHRKLHKLEKASAAADGDVICKEEEGPFHCQDCEKICSTKASFVLHCKVHKVPPGKDTDTLSFHCKDCDKDFASKGSLSMHLKNHSAHRADSESNADPKQSFPCKDCDKVCSTKASFVLHRKMHQSPSAGDQNPDMKVENETPGFPCKDCSKVCSTKASLAMHSKVHKSPSAKEQTSDDAAAPGFRCKKCNVVFHTKVNFILHKKSHKLSSIQKKPKSGAGPASFRCKRCDIMFPTKANLILHRKEHKAAGGEENPKADGEPKSFPCKKCDKICPTKSSLVLHLKAHKLASLGESPEGDSVGPFTCQDCDKVCSTKASFVLHRKVHKSSSSDPSVKGEQEETFECKECSRMFSSKGRLSFHCFKKHGVPPKGDQALADEATSDKPKKVNEDKTYPCTICELKFTKLKLLVQHKAVHGDRTATPCTYCGKRFLYKKSLFNHMTICQSKAKGRKLLLLKKAAAAKRKLAKEGGGSAAEESAQKKRKTEEKKKTLTQKAKAKTQPEKTKKPNKDKAKAKAEQSKTKEKHTKADGEAAEDEGKKTAPEKPNDARPDKPADSAPQEPSGKEKANAAKIKRLKKEAPGQKNVRNTKKWRVMAAATAKKKKLQAVVVGGKKKLLVKNKKVPVKLKPGAKSGQTSKEN